LIRAWPGAVAQVPGAKLVIVGDGDDAERLRHLAGDCGVSGSVRFTGFLSRPALEEEFKSAALFAMPSRGEGFGLVYLEAMAHGLACVGSGRDAASEVIDDGTTGVLVNPDDTATLLRTIVGLLESPARRWSMGEAGRARVAHWYQYDRFRREVASALERAFVERGSAG
jgi:phosphatidylinositol alpha-1,6-mannosyltransferase